MALALPRQRLSTLTYPSRFRLFFKPGTLRHPALRHFSLTQRNRGIEEQDQLNNSEPGIVKARRRKTSYLESFPRDPDAHRFESRQKQTLGAGKLFTDTNRLTISPVFLREACKCIQCVDPSTRQREFSFADIPSNIAIAATEYDADGNVTISWENDLPGFSSHTSTYTPTQIKQLKSSPTPEIIALWNSSLFQRETLRINFDEFIRDEQTLAQVLRLLRRHGLVFIDNVPEEETSVAILGERLGPLRNTFYGSTWNVRSVPQAKNVAYTSKYLGFHMDLLYMKEPPRYQLLHCLQNTCKGGESRFVDTFKALELVIRTHGLDTFDALLHTKILYGYNNDKHHYASLKNIIAPKRQHKEHRLLTEHWHLEAFNKLKYVGVVHWSPPFATAFDETYRFDDRVPVDNLTMKDILAACKAFAETLEKEELVFELKMEPGTCAIFDNLRVVHARNSFDMNSGKRWLRGAYVNAQEVQSREIELADTIHALNRDSTTDVLKSHHR